MEDEEFIREIFRRLQLGVRLNAGELLKTHTGTIRDFVYVDLGREAPFIRNTSLSERRFSRQLALAQICINSFARGKSGEFVRARYDDLEDFFKSYYNLSEQDENLVRIKSVLKLMDREFGQAASEISSRAVAASVYFLVEEMIGRKQSHLVSKFADFVVALLVEIKKSLKQLNTYQPPQNQLILEEFQKYVSQASVEPYAIKRRHQFLEKAFKHYISPRTRGQIISR